MKKGFSILEIMLTIAVITILLSFSLPVSIQVIAKNAERNSEINATVALRVAREKAVFGLRDSEWSVRIDSNSATIFLGEDYDTRDSSLDQVYELKNVSISTPIIITFDSITGFSDATNINLTTEKIININKYGLII